MQDGCKVCMESLHDMEWIMFHDHLDYFQIPPLGGRSSTKPGDHGTSNTHNRWFQFISSCVRTHVNRNSLKQHLVEGPVTYDFTLNLRVRDHTTSFWRYVGTVFGHLGPLHTRAKSHDLVMVRTLDSHPKAVLWVLGMSLQVVTDPQAEHEVRMDLVAGPFHILLAEKGGGFGLIQYVSNSTNLREFVYLAIYYEICHARKILKKSQSPKIRVMPTSWRQARQKFRETMKPYPQPAMQDSKTFHP